jgi:betaine-aldehyde dehydrogenase
MPRNLDLYYGGAWHVPACGYLAAINPANQQALAHAAVTNAADIDAAVQAAHGASWYGAR